MASCFLHFMWNSVLILSRLKDKESIVKSFEQPQKNNVKGQAKKASRYIKMAF